MPNDNFTPSEQSQSNPNTPSRSAGERVIQPLSPDLETPPQDAPTPVARAQVRNQVPINNSHDIYPEVTRGIGVPDLPNRTQPAQAGNLSDNQTTSGKTKIITMAVMGFGGFIAAFATLSLVNWIQILSLPGAKGALSVLGVSLAAGELILGIGIYMRREVARAIYVFIALILLILSSYATYKYLTEFGKINQANKENIASIDQTISKYQNNPDLQASQKTSLINSLQATEKLDKAVVSKNKAIIWPIVEGYAVSITPIVFLTRTKVKEVFV